MSRSIKGIGRKRICSDVLWIRKTEEIHWWRITKSGQEVLDESNEITNEFIRRVFEKTDKEEMARLVSYIHQQYDLAKEELEKIRQSQKKAADKHTGANHSANVRFTDS